jgi:hypothetical protein
VLLCADVLGFQVMTGAFAIWVFTDFEKTLDPLYLDQVGPVVLW